MWFIIGSAQVKKTADAILFELFFILFFHGVKKDIPCKNVLLN